MKWPELILLNLFPMVTFLMGTVLSTACAYGLWVISTLEANEEALFFKILLGVCMLAGGILVFVSCRGLRSLWVIVKTVKILQKNGQHQKAIFKIECEDLGRGEFSIFRFRHQNINYVSFSTWAPPRTQLFPLGENTNVWSMDGFLFHGQEPDFLLLTDGRHRIWLHPESH